MRVFGLLTFLFSATKISKWKTQWRKSRPSRAQKLKPKCRRLSGFEPQRRIKQQHRGNAGYSSAQKHGIQKRQGRRHRSQRPRNRRLQLISLLPAELQSIIYVHLFPDPHYPIDMTLRQVMFAKGGKAVSRSRWTYQSGTDYPSRTFLEPQTSAARALMRTSRLFRQDVALTI